MDSGFNRAGGISCHARIFGAYSAFCFASSFRLRSCSSARFHNCRVRNSEQTPVDLRAQEWDLCVISTVFRQACFVFPLLSRSHGSDCFSLRPQSVAQITVGSVISVPDDMSRPCPELVTTTTPLSTPRACRRMVGSIREACRSTAITPLFDGIPLGTNMQTFFDSPGHPPLFTVQITPWESAILCGELQAEGHPLRFASGGGPPMDRQFLWGSMCTSEVTRVNGVATPPIAPAPPSPVIRPTAQAKMTTLLGGIANELARVPQMSGCGPTAAAATESLDQQVWKLLQNVATVRSRAFRNPLLRRSTRRTRAPRSAISALPDGWEAFNAPQTRTGPSSAGATRHIPVA